jgi:hypothetical protein
METGFGGLHPPPPSPWVETFVNLLVFMAPEWGLFAPRARLCGRSLLGRRPRLRVCLRIKNFRSPAQAETGSMTGWLKIRSWQLDSVANFGRVPDRNRASRVKVICGPGL